MKPAIEDHFCHQDLPLTMPVTKTARQWAEEFGLKWETVRKRRYRGWSWSDALNPKLRRTPFNDAGLR